MSQIEKAVQLLRGWRQTRIEFGNGIIAKAGDTVRQFGD
jgi:hypothetical protein